MKSRTTLAGVLALLLVAFFGMTGKAGAYVYWSSDASVVGRANLDGSGVNQRYVHLRYADSPNGLAADSGHLYWGVPDYTWMDYGDVGRATLNGTGVEEGFLAGKHGPIALGGGKIYFEEPGGGIGRANLDGTDVETVISSAYGRPLGIAVDASYIYWTDPDHSRIGRAKLDGSDVQFHYACQAYSIAVDSGHVYWTTNECGTYIVRSDLSGNNIEDFIPLPEGVLSGLAVDGSHIYWANSLYGFIGRANLDGTGVDENFITGLDSPTSVAVDSLNPSPDTITLAASKSTSVYGDPPDFTATVKSTSGTPTGTVQFYTDEDTPDGAPVPLDANGRAQHTPVYPIDVGGTVTAEYNGDVNFTSSTAAYHADVHAAQTSTSIGATTVSTASGVKWILTAQVTNTDSDAVPFGSIHFYVNGVDNGTWWVDEDGQATLNAGILPPGAVVVARYEDDTAGIPDFMGSEGSFTVPGAVPRPPPRQPNSHAPNPFFPRPGEAFWFAGHTSTQSNGSATVTVQTKQAGTLTATATTSAKLAHGRARAASAVYGTGTAALAGAGTVQLVIHPNKRARRALKRGGTFRLSISVTFHPNGGPAYAHLTKLVRAVVVRPRPH